MGLELKFAELQPRGLILKLPKLNLGLRISLKKLRIIPNSQKFLGKVKIKLRTARKLT